MNERITLVSSFNQQGLNKIKKYLEKTTDKLCKVPFIKTIDNRLEVDTLPYHFTISTWGVEVAEKVKTELQKTEFSKLKIYVDNIKIMCRDDNTYILYFNIRQNKKLKALQKNIYNILPNDKYNPETFNFHITIHIDRDYNKLLLIKEKILSNFKPFTFFIDTFCLYEIYPAKLIQEFKANIS